MKATSTIERELVETGRSLSGTLARLLDLMIDLEENEHHIDSYPDAATWLSWNLGLTKRTSRRWIRTARSLTELPALRGAFSNGHLSWDHVEMLLRVATPDNELELLEVVGEIGDADALRDEIRVWERQANAAAEEEPQDLPAGPVLDTSWRDDRLELQGSIPGADGLIVEKALLRLAEQAPKDEASGVYRDFDVRAGEALIQMASQALAGDSDPDRATIVVHMSAEDIVAGHGPGWDAATTLFTVGELERLACDARLQPALEDSNGVTVGVGRTTRQIPAWLRRLVMGRDRHCRFPGCDRTRWLHVHHLIPWSQGGPTNLDNLMALCGFHHRLIHNKRWRIEGNPEGDPEFYNGHGLLHVPAMRKEPPNWEAFRLDQIESHIASKATELAGAPP